MEVENPYFQINIISDPRLVMPHVSKAIQNKILQQINEGNFRDWIGQIEENLDLVYLQQHHSDPNLCLQHAEEVRDEYKTYFSSLDFLHFLLGIETDINTKGMHKTIIPKNSKEFWKWVHKGSTKNNTT